MKGYYNTIEEYNEAYRKRLQDTWETEVRLCKNWLDGHRSRSKVGWLCDCRMTDEHIKEKLEYGQNILNNLDHYVQKHSYEYKKPQRQKDNDLSFIAESDGWAHCSAIRVPKLKRKSAWKRFYKMFPALKGMKTIPGKSSCYTLGKNGKMIQTIQNPSTIKLKKRK